MKTILVTGATGFIGRRFCVRMQADGVRVVAVGRTPQEGPWDNFFTHDFASTEPFPGQALVGVEAVFHFASKAHAVSEVVGSEEGYQPVIVDGTRHLLEAMKAAGVGRLVYLSSVKAMGDAGYRKPQKQPLTEATPGEPTTPYGRAKAEAEALVLNSGLPHAVVLRPTMVYGPGQKGNLDRMADAIKRRRFPPLRDNSNVRSLVHVDNVVEACRAVAAHPLAAGQLYLLAERPPVSTRQLYDRLRAEMNLTPIWWGIPSGFLLVAAKGGDVLGKVFRRRMPLDTDTVWKLLGSAWYDGGKIERDLGFVYQPQKKLLS
jgi:UDP-glucose 4-epimerase